MDLKVDLPTPCFNNRLYGEWSSRGNYKMLDGNCILLKHSTTRNLHLFQLSTSLQPHAYVVHMSLPCRRNRKGCRLHVKTGSLISHWHISFSTVTAGLGSSLIFLRKRERKSYTCMLSRVGISIDGFGLRRWT